MDPAGNSRGRPFRKCVTCTIAVTAVLVGLVVAVVVLAGALGPQRLPPAVAWCPDSWIGYQEKCYYFSKAELSWNDSRTNCSALGASLAAIDSEQELTFLMRYRGISEHWIGLWREQEGQPWKWVNGSKAKVPLLKQGGGDCAYLYDRSVGSSSCITERNWVCSKPDAHTVQQSAMLRSQELINP